MIITNIFFAIIYKLFKHLKNNISLINKCDIIGRMKEVILDALLDSLKILAVVAVFQIIIALIEPKMSEKVKFKGKFAPLIGVSISLLPQCGFSVVATDLYQKKHITLGTLIGVYLATSDEALPVFLSAPDKALHVLPLLALKFALGLIFGYAIDLILANSRKKVEHHVAHCNEEYKIKLTDCTNAELVEKSDVEKAEQHCDCDCEDCKENDCSKQQEVKEVDTQKDDEQEESNLHRFVIHPLRHSLEIFIYVFAVNIIFGIIIYRIGENAIIDFLTTNKYLAPFLAVIVGAIPNCVSSIVLSELYIMGGLGFGATLGGLCMNAGIAFVYLFKDVQHTKRNVLVFTAMLLISTFIAYVFSFIFGFQALNF